MPHDTERTPEGISGAPQGFVLVARDLPRPQFFTDYGTIVTAHPRFKEATVFQAEDAARKVISGFEGEKNAPPFEVMPVEQAALLPNII